MQHKNFRKRQGVSLKKAQVFHLAKNIEIFEEKDEENNHKAPQSRFVSIKDLCKKNQTPRSKTTRNSKYESTPYVDENFVTKKLPNKKNPSKFAKLHLISPITQCDQNIHHLVNQITPKAQGFYRFGMKSYEKPSHKRVYSDMMNMPLQSTKGVMYIGELWNNKMSSKFLKLNKMNMNKLNFFEKLRDLKWDRIKNQREKQLNGSNLISFVKQKSLKSFPTMSHFQSLLSLKHFKQAEHETLKNFSQQKQTQQMLRLQKYEKNSKEYKEIISAIRKTIDEEKTRCRGQHYWKDMKNLESWSHEMHKLWDKYFDKMLQIN